MAKQFSFRKALNRSESLIKFTAKFLEPNIQERVQIKNALQDYWIRIGTVKTPAKARYISTENHHHISTVPIMTEAVMKSPEFNYQMTEHDKSMSNFNYVFDPDEEYDEE